MKKISTKVTAVVLAIAMLGFQVESNTMVAEAAKKTVKVGKGKYTVTSEKKKTARFDKVAKKSVTTVTIPATVKIGKKTYKVTAIKANALKGNKKIKKLTIGKNVVKIGKKAFYRCKNLKNITINTTKLTTKSVGANAFKGLNSKVKIKVPASKATAYQTLLKAKGVTGKNQVITSGKATADNQKPTSIPNPVATLNIQKMVYDKYVGWTWNWDTNTTEEDCAVGENKTFYAYVKIPTEAYGYWTTEKVTTDWKKTCHCGLAFQTKEDFNEHGNQTGDGAYDITKSTRKSITFDANIWHEDKSPCNIVYRIAIPEGMEVNQDNVSIAQLALNGTLKDAVDKKYYQISVENKTLTINIYDIKSDGFRIPTSGNISYLPIVVSFSAKVTESAQAVNTVSASVSYNCGKYNGTIGAGSISIFTSGLEFNNINQNCEPVSAGYTLYKSKQTSIGGNIYEPVTQEKTGENITFPALGTGQYKLVETTTPYGYWRMDDYEFCIDAAVDSTKFTQLAISGTDGNSIPAPGGDKWHSDLSTATSSSQIVHMPNEFLTRKAAATIKYSLDGNITETETITEKVQVLETNAWISKDKIPAKTFDGWKLDKITLDGEIAGTSMEELPDTIPEDSTLIFEYIIDEEQTHEITADIKYFLDNISQPNDNWTIKQEVQALSSTIDLTMPFKPSNHEFERDYEGYTFYKMFLVDSSGTKTELYVLPETIESGSTIQYHYVKNNDETEILSMTVKYSLNGTIQENDTFVYSAEVPKTDGYLRNITLPEKTYEGYYFYQYQNENGSTIHSNGSTLTSVQSGKTLSMRLRYQSSSVPPLI